MYSASGIVCVCVCLSVFMHVSVPMFVLLHNPRCSLSFFFNLFLKSNLPACVSNMMWNRVPCSHCSMQYFVPPVVCSGLGDCEETSCGMSCGVCMGVRAVCK
jgi:hypothetical protein